MQPSSHVLSFLTILFLSLTCTPIAAFAVPESTTYSATQRHSDTTQQPSKFRTVFPQLTWLRDTAIEKIFGLPRKTAKTGADKPSYLSRPSNTQLPATLLAKYGGDVVLRFNLSTPQEEQALAEAADTLFLDVWEFTNNWADIRLRQDDVGSKTYTCMDNTDEARSLPSLDYSRSPYKRHILT